VAAVTCPECRDLFSARVDDALAPDERARLDAHLTGCVECLREWERFEAAVSLVRSVEPARAPAGFVDRVVAARPESWHRRLLRQAFDPWARKLPLEAAAVILVGGLAVMLFQRSPELQHSALAPELSPMAKAVEPAAPRSAPEAPSPREALEAPRSAREAPPPWQALEPERAAPDAPAARRRLDAPRSAPEPLPAAPGPSIAAGRAPAPPAVPRAQEPATTAERPTRPTAPPAAQAVPEQRQVFGQRDRAPSIAQDSRNVEPRADAQSRTDEAVRKSLERQAELGGVRRTAPTPLQSYAEPRVKEAELAAKRREADQAGKVEAFAPRLSARLAPDVDGRITVTDRAVAAGQIKALVARVGGSVTAQRGDELELTVPGDAWDQFSAQLARLGGLAMERRSLELPPAVRVVLRLRDAN
jgi:Putative zinc-finger